MARARLLDLTRSLRRAGRGVTGVDRVELAYLEHFLADEAPVFGVIRTAFGYVILDSQGLGKFFNNLQGANSWGAASVLSRLARGRSASVKRAESDVRRWSIARSVRSRLAQMLQKTLPDGFDYYNVGHSNLTDRMMRGVKAGMINGHGHGFKFVGNGNQMPGMFMIKEGKIIRKFIHEYASDRPDYVEFVEFALLNADD